jgi:hypothetical protein
MKNLRRKFPKTSLALLGVLLLIGGTFAYTDIAQIADNTAEFTAEPGARLHDDFNNDNGNKDIYVENFGNNFVLVRVKLYEYLEANGSPLIEGADPDDVLTWSPYTITDNAGTLGADTQLFRSYVTWKFGLPTNNAGQKIYLPTFNQDNTSLISDASGDGLDVITGAPTATGDGTHDYFQPLTQYPSLNDPSLLNFSEKTLPIAYDLSAWNLSVGWLPGQHYGSFWAPDSDGWFYWAMPLPPGFSTGLLLDQLNYIKHSYPVEYKIQPVMEAVTINDYMKFFDGSSPYGDGSANAQAALSSENGTSIGSAYLLASPQSITVNPGDTVNIRSAGVTLTDNVGAGTNVTSTATVVAMKGQQVADTTFSANTVTIGADETSDTIQIAVQAGASPIAASRQQGVITLIVNQP